MGPQQFQKQGTGAFPLQELRGHFTGPLVRVSTTGTSPEGPFTGTLTESLLQGRFLDRPGETPGWGLRLLSLFQSSLGGSISAGVQQQEIRPSASRPSSS